MVRRIQCCFGTRCDWQTERRFGGGYLLNWGPHIVYPALSLFESPPVTVFGRMRQVINPGDAEDMFLAIITLADGTVVQAEHMISANDMPTWILQGDRGTITVRDMDMTLSTKAPERPGDPTQYAAMKAQDAKVTDERITGSRYGDEHEIYVEIAQTLRGKGEYRVNTAEAARLSRVLDAIRLSSEKNRIVTLKGGS